MARTYAGILGLLAFLVNLTRGLLSGGDPAATVRTACASLAVFVVVGLVLGQLAAWIVESSAVEQLKSQLAERESKPRVTSHPNTSGS